MLLDIFIKATARTEIYTQIDNTLVQVENLITAIYKASSLTKIYPGNLHTYFAPDINLKVVLDGSLTHFIV